MSFNASVYFNDSDISSTNIKATNGVGETLLNVTKYYGDSAYITKDFPDSTLIKFTATPKSGCHFTKWYYRIGGDSGDLQDSEDNPFYYSGTEDIIIRAEGEADDIEEPIYWGAIGETTTYVGDYGATIEGQLSEYTVIRYPIYFDNDGYVGITVECDSNVELYLGNDDKTYGDEINFETGIPLYYTDSSSNGYISQAYTSSSDVATHYLFIRGQTGTETDSFRINITPQWFHSMGYITVPETGLSKTINVSSHYLTKWRVSSSKSGNITISITGNFPVMCWVGTHPDYGLDSPLIFDAYGELTNISIPYSAEQGVYYYIWLRPYYPANSGTITLNISYDGESSIKKWSWSTSNSTATDHVTSASVTLNSYYALNKDNPTSDFSHFVWMDMVDKVWEVIWNKTKYWDSNYADKDTTRNLSQNSDGLYELTAVAFNSLRNNIELIGNRSDVLGRKTGIGQVFAQNVNYPVKAEYFLTLADYINDCIDNL